MRGSEPGDANSPSQSAPGGAPPVTVIFAGTPRGPKPSTDWLRLISSAPAVLAFLGLVVYGVVRTGHDAFYSRFGVTAEGVGLSQSTIVGRASLYFIFFLTAVVSLVGIAGLVMGGLVRSEAERRRAAEAPGGSRAWWALVGVTVLALTAATGLGAVVVAGIEGLGSLALAIAVVLPLAAVAALGTRLSTGRRILAGILFGALAVWSAAVAVMVSRSGSESHPGAASLPSGSRWLLFAFCFLAVALASASLLRQFETSDPTPTRASARSRQTYLIMLSLLASLPLALVFVAPRAGRFLTGSADRAVVAAVIWALLFAMVVLGFEAILERPPEEPAPVTEMAILVALVSVLAGSALFLAWKRGLDLADQVLAGNRITQSGFGTFSVRADIVCLDPVSAGDELPSELQAPFVYLGQSNGQLVLFDLQRRETVRARELLGKTDIGAPERVPLHVPAGGFVIRIANLVDPDNPYVVPVVVRDPNPPHKKRRLAGKWDCFRAKTASKR